MVVEILEPSTVDSFCSVEYGVCRLNTLSMVEYAAGNIVEKVERFIRLL